MSKLGGRQFFSSEKEIYNLYLERTNQKQRTAEVIADAISNLFPEKNLIKLFSIGGGTGEADLEVVAKLPKYSFEIENIDPSPDMCKEFSRQMPRLKNAKLIKNYCQKFEDLTTPVGQADLILAINSVYFLESWKKIDLNNPLLKIYSALREGGFAAVVLKSHQSDHYRIKKIAGAGNTCGISVRKVLDRLKIPYYWENIDANINISDIFNNKVFDPNENGVKLLSFLSKGGWENLSLKQKTAIKRLMSKLKVFNEGKYLLNSAYELIWIYKPHTSLNSNKSDPLVQSKTYIVAEKIRQLVRVVPHFPIKNVYFRDTSPLLRSPEAFRDIIDYVAEVYKNTPIDWIVAKDMQGVLWAGALAKELNAGIIPTFRKDVTPPVLTAKYSHEYNPNRIINLQKEAIKKGDRVLIVDYMIATGSTVLNMAKLVERLGGKVVGVFSLMELEYLNPRNILPEYDIHTIVKYYEPGES